MTRINAYTHLFCPWKQPEPLLFEHEHALGSAPRQVAYHGWRARFLIDIAHHAQWWSWAFWTDRIRDLDDVCNFVILSQWHGLWVWWSTMKCHARGSYMKYHNELYLFGKVASAITYANCCKILSFKILSRVISMLHIDVHSLTSGGTNKTIIFLDFDQDDMNNTSIHICGNTNGYIICTIRKTMTIYHC